MPTCTYFMHIVEMGGWMTCNFTSFSTVFKSYQDNGWPIMKGCVQWSLYYGQKDFRLKQGSNQGPLDQ